MIVTVEIDGGRYSTLPLTPALLDLLGYQYQRLILAEELQGLHVPDLSGTTDLERHMLRESDTASYMRLIDTTRYEAAAYARTALGSGPEVVALLVEPTARIGVAIEVFKSIGVARIEAAEAAVNLPLSQLPASPSTGLPVPHGGLHDVIVQDGLSTDSTTESLSPLL